MTPEYKTGLSADEINNSAFAKIFPKQWKTYVQNNQTDTLTDFGGNVNYSKNDNVNPPPEGFKHAQPYLKNLWLGYPFSYEYRAARGHTYALLDIMKIDRINTYSEKAGLPSTCWNCKTTKMIPWYKEYGDKFWTMEFNSFRQKQDISDHSIGCAYCHEPQTMKLRITSVPLNAALKEMGKDPEKLPRNEMRALVCGQCHVEYYFKDKNLHPDEAAKPTFPWNQGFDPENMYEYYNGHGSTKEKGFEGKFVDWVHPVSKTPMLKAQHPEYEMWVNGPHGAAGVSCADCHMSYVRQDDKKKSSGHQWASPLMNIDRACRTCHADKSPEYLKERVLFTQKRVYDQLILAQEESVRAHEAVRLANEFAGAKNADYENLVIQAKEMIRKGQFFWDLVSAENSVGFHNPVKALDTLAKSQQYSKKAQELAAQATNFTITKDITGDIKKIVPPILKHSRELQMDPEHMKTHQWFKYLPLTPKAPKVWDVQTRLIPPPADNATAPAAPAAPANATAKS